MLKILCFDFVYKILITRIEFFLQLFRTSFHKKFYVESALK